jgi:hypothetical protein
VSKSALLIDTEEVYMAPDDIVKSLISKADPPIVVKVIVSSVAMNEMLPSDDVRSV